MADVSPETSESAPSAEAVELHPDMFNPGDDVFIFDNNFDLYEGRVCI